MKKPRILLADDHVLVVEALRGMLASVSILFGSFESSHRLAVIAPEQVDEIVSSAM